MNDVLRQRLVGALVLIALGVIFWPIIFVEPGMEPMLLGSQVPKAPEIAYFELEPPKPSDNVAAVNEQIEQVEAQASLSVDPDLDRQSSDYIVPSRKKPKAISVENPKLDSKGIPIAWVLQVASFSHRDKADKLQKDLIKMGYKADTRVIRSGSAKMVRVSVGPKFNKQSLVETKAAIDKRFKVKSLIARYVP